MPIDAHQHFWTYQPDEFGWIDDSMRTIRRDFYPADLAPHLRATGVTGTVAVQARQSLVETDWLLSLARHERMIKGVVGWVPLEAEGAAVRATLERLRNDPAFKGVRHVLQAEAVEYFERPRFNDALRVVAQLGLTYDLLVFHHQLPATFSWVDRHPDLPIVIDHLAKPQVVGAPSADWRRNLQALARRPRVHCKLSGLVTEVPGFQWTPDLVRPYLDVVLEAFGPERVMFGSDWPVCLVATNYERWHGLITDLVAPLSPSEREEILGGTATRFYQLS